MSSRVRLDLGDVSQQKAKWWFASQQKEEEWESVFTLRGAFISENLHCAPGSQDNLVPVEPSALAAAV